MNLEHIKLRFQSGNACPIEKAMLPKIEFDYILGIVDEQQRTIAALDSCINGPDSTTTENLTVVDRLEKRIRELEDKLRGSCMCGAKPSCDYEWGPDCDLGKSEAHAVPVLIFSLQPKF